MADSREVERRLVMKRVLSVLKHFGPEFVPCGDADDRNVVVALPDDTIEYMLGRVRSFNGCANVVAPVAGGRLAVIVVDTCGPRPETASDDECGPISPLASVGVLLDYMRARRGRPFYCRVELPDASLELIESWDDDLLTL